LFKLFGFLEETSQINTKGIGLGLHICKIIAEKLGGDIICKSQWQVGTSFILLIPLEEKLNTS
jgi:signal transduction histidine kinase